MCSDDIEISDEVLRTFNPVVTFPELFSIDITLPKLIPWPTIVIAGRYGKKKYFRHLSSF